jgi:hypothetical protein
MKMREDSIATTIAIPVGDDGSILHFTAICLLSFVSSAPLRLCGEG